VTEVSRRCTSYALTKGRTIITRYKKAIAVIAIGAMIASVFYEGILFVSLLANDDGNKQLKKQVSSVCGECKFQFYNHSQSVNSTAQVVRVTQSGGFGRTGNSVATMMKAMKLAYACKSKLELPSTDDYGSFDFQDEFRLIDFSQRQGEASSHPNCASDHQGDSIFFWEFDELAMTDYASLLQPEVMHDLWTCMRQFLGICVEGLCLSQQSVQEGVLTVHLRQGDIYVPDFGHVRNPYYQQPFLDYYYSVINFTNPFKVIFVGEPFNHGPVWKAFERLHSFGMTKFDIQLQSLSFREDLVTLLCARTIVESISSMNPVIRLGFAKQRFSTCCENHFPESQQVYRVDTGKYNNGRHDNSANEWVAMLVNGESTMPRLCINDTSHCGTPTKRGWEQ